MGDYFTKRINAQRIKDHKERLKKIEERKPGIIFLIIINYTVRIIISLIIIIALIIIIIEMVKK